MFGDQFGSDRLNVPAMDTFSQSFELFLINISVSPSWLGC